MSDGRGVYAALDRLYKTLPGIACQGLCSACCGPITMSPTEARRIMEKTHRPVEHALREGFLCPFLDQGTRRCTVYNIRPLICRLWGVTTGMPCEFGCTPERVLTTDEVKALKERLERIAGRMDVKTCSPQHWNDIMAVKRVLDDEARRQELPA